jgi:N-acetylglutamate synthase-like GNAT family acetyltransferase
MDVRKAQRDDLPAAQALMKPFVTRGELLPRALDELVLFLPNAFVVEAAGRMVGFAALEIYSWKLAEIQCLAFHDAPPRATETIRRLVGECVTRARDRAVLEVVVVVQPALEDVLKTCGFHYALPDSRKAMFARPGKVDRTQLFPKDPEGVPIRDAVAADIAWLPDFLTPFVARRELLARSTEELKQLLRHAFVAEADGRVAGFAAVELYSPKLAELQCLSVDNAFRGRGIGRRLTALCIQRAREHDVFEVMAITSREEVFRACGFGSGLAGPEMALFLRTRER